MATKTVCDTCGAVRPKYPTMAGYLWLKLTGPTSGDFCSRKCAVEALGGDCPDGLSPKHEGAERV